jgi:signal transduction histidine kinase
VTLVRVHPDAAGVTLSTQYGDPVDTAAELDPRQIERAIYNLLLNACQSRGPVAETRNVKATLETTQDAVTLIVIDDGPGVPDDIRDSLFDPFVSVGKQKGTGLGLTLVNSIAVEHGGGAVLVSSRPGETIFLMNIKRKSARAQADKSAFESGVAIE